MSSRGTSLLDLVIALAVITVAGGMAVLKLEQAIADVRQGGAARAFAMRVRQTRAEAVRRSAAVGLQFVTTDTGREFQTYVDGNGNGLRAREMTTRVDPPLGPAARLTDAMGGVEFGLDRAIPPVGADDGADAGGGAEGADRGGDGGGEDDGGGGAGGGGDEGGGVGRGDDPIRVGASDRLTFGPTGSGTSGTIYVRGSSRQFAVRIHGPTGRIRLLEFDRAAAQWVER